MQYTPTRAMLQVAPVRLHALAVFTFLVLALVGQTPECSAGWLTNPPQVLSLSQPGRGRRRTCACEHHTGSIDWWQVGQRGQLTCLRSLLLWLLTWRDGHPGAGWPAAVPWLLWGWQEAGRFWPWLLRQPEWRRIGWLLWQGQRFLLLWLVADAARTALLACLPPRAALPQNQVSLPLVGIGALAEEEPTASVSVSADENAYLVKLQGSFTLRVGKDDPFRRRFLILFLGLLDVPGQTRQSRRTRDGRTPFVRQEQMATWFGVPAPDISRWYHYWLKADWRRLLSVRAKEILTLELQQRVIQTFARFPWLSDEAVWQHLQGQGVDVSQSQVHQAAQESGWSFLRERLQPCFHLGADGCHFKEEYVLNQLLTQVQTLLGKLEAGATLTPEEHLDLADLKTFCAAVGLAPQPPLQALPWLLRVEQVLFGQWEAVTAAQVRCPACGSPHVVRKSREPRRKWYYDEQKQLQSVEVYRYYCRNQACAQGSFTNLPPGLVLYSRHRLETHLLATQMYEWGYSTYRRTGTALGVSSMTAYRWVSALGHDLLPVAALFGVVKSSGVIGVDEKYVLVPTNAKPAGDMKRWMYVYVAVDMYTYDLLHIAIYPYNTKASALAFLLAVRAKGYHPRGVVTDLRVDYESALAEVFPQAVHHLCLFHAAQDVQDHLQQVYGAGYAQSHPEAETLKAMIYAALNAETKRTAQARYEKVMALRKQYVAETPGAVVVFDFLETHWPKLVNGIESDRIPRTNNTTELVIRRFDQHYQNFCGFDTQVTAQQYLGVFEKVYRFTPFSQDAQPRIRGKCPLQLTGYDVSRLPMTTICAGLSIVWPIPQEHVPNS
ncbi:MAG: transposase [Chloroflexi bacterium]|nr:transposase [Chloroflexota bacterium]